MMDAHVRVVAREKDVTGYLRSRKGASSKCAHISGEGQQSNAAQKPDTATFLGAKNLTINLFYSAYVLRR